EIPPEDFIRAEQPAGAAAPPVMTPNPVYQNLTSEMRKLKTEIDIREREKIWIESEIAKYSERVRNAPAREQDMSEVLRVNTELKKQYEDLKDKLGQAKLSQSLESGQKGSQFVVVDPANYPLSPTKPNKPLVVLVGIAISLGIGVSLATVMDVLNQKIWSQTEIEQLYDIPALAEIPEIVTDADLSSARKKRLTHAPFAFVADISYIGCLYSV